MALILSVVPLDKVRYVKKKARKCQFPAFGGELCVWPDYR